MAGIFITNALLAEIVGVKIFSAENTVGLPPAQIRLFGEFVLDFNLTAGVILWPVVFITTDIIIIGSLTAFLIGQLLDVFIFQKLRKYTGSKMIWLRATGSTLVSQFVDSFVVLGIAFYIFGNWSLSQVVAVGVINYIYKFVVAIVLTPLIYLAHNLIDGYLGKEQASQMTQKATEGSDSFF